MKFLEKYITKILFGTFILSLIFISYAWYNAGQQEMVNKLCNKKVYDFCKVTSVRYVLKTNF